MSTDDRRIAGRYALHASIGRGGMGEVWRATDTVLGREVAVKTIDLTRTPDDSGSARFEREARVTAGISHPNVVTVHDAGVEDDTAYLVMELLPGPSLADRLAQGPLAVDEVVSVGEQVASALEAAHARGLVHRDVKPGNIVEDGEGRLRVLDFGITQLGEAAGEQTLTATHTVMGTAEYLAPEQASGARVDGRADLYALGCVLFALLAGQAPYRGSSPVATMMMHANDPVPDVRSLRPDTPPWLADVVTRLLAKDPSDRPEHAADVARALRERRGFGAAPATTVLPAAGPATTQRLDPVPPPPAARPALPPDAQARGRRGSRAPLALLAAVVLFGLLAWWALGRDGTEVAASPTGSSPSSATTSAAPATSEPTTETSAPAPSETAPAGPSTPAETADPAAGVRAAAQALLEGLRLVQGDGPGKENKELDKAQRDLDRSLNEADPEALAEARDTLVEEYDKAVEDGAVSSEAAIILDPLVAAFSNAVDDYSG